MKQYLFLVLLLTLNACSFVRLKNPTKSYLYLPQICQEQIEKIRLHFFYDKKCKHYVLNSVPIQPFFSKSVLLPHSKTCVQLLQEGDIFDIFGNPSKRNQKGLYYILDNVPHPKYGSLYCLTFYKNESNVIMSCRIGYVNMD